MTTAAVAAYLRTVVLILALISAHHCIPIEVVYTGDSCDCPKSLNYLVNAPPPPEEKENPRYEHGYKLDVPVPAKAKLTYSFDFTVEEPKTPSPVEEEKWNLYAKVDRITAHKKDCVATTARRTCGCGEKCECSRNSKSRCRYVSPLEEAFRRSLQTYDHPNRVYKRHKRRPVTAVAWAAFIKPLNELKPVDEAAAAPLKSRRRRDLSKLFGFNRKPQIEKRPERMVKQYNKRLPTSNDYEKTASPTLLPKFEQNLKPFSVFPTLPVGKGPFAKFREMMLAHSLRNKRDIKGEYDLLEKEREQLDLTLPEIIQFMPETLDPNFKRGQCQFANCQRHRQLQQQQHHQQAQEELFQQVEANKVSAETSESSGDAMNTEASGDHSDDDNVSDDIDSDNSNEDPGVGDNDISSAPSSHRKRNADHYGCSHFQHFTSPSPPSDGFYIQAYDSSSDILPRPFAVAGNVYGPDPAPQQYVVGPPQFYPMSYPGRQLVMSRSMDDDVHIVRGPIYNHPMSPRQHANAQLDQVIADIVSQHVAFIEASSHKGGALVDPPVLQDHETKSFLKLLAEGRFHKMFGDEDRTYTFPPLDYQYYPPSYSSQPYYH